jgi:RHH-type rel operon transcriptional repressor/antitoxin RelB
MTMLSIRLDPETENDLSRSAEALGVTKSEFIRQLIQQKLEANASKTTPWQLGHELFGREGSGQNDRSRNRKKILKEKLRAKTSHH